MPPGAFHLYFQWALGTSLQAKLTQDPLLCYPCLLCGSPTFQPLRITVPQSLSWPWTLFHDPPSGLRWPNTPSIDLSMLLVQACSLCLHWALLFWGLNPDPDFLPGRPGTLLEAVSGSNPLCSGEDAWGVGDTGLQDSDRQEVPGMIPAHPWWPQERCSKLVFDSMEGDGGNGSLGWGCRELSFTMQASFPCIRRVSNLGFPLICCLFFDLVDLGSNSKDLPLSPAVLSASRKEAVRYFSHHLNGVASCLPQPDQLTWLRLVIDISRASGTRYVPKTPLQVACVLDFSLIGWFPLCWLVIIWTESDGACQHSKLRSSFTTMWYFI